ncbi:MAG: hypothetical protein IID50_06305 [Proteobacteria bacterium]|nr:hypothetical protein [Pseudomonadota bacterium]
MRRIVKTFRRPRRAAYATGTAAYQGFRTASRTLRDAPHRHSARFAMPPSPQRTLRAENLGKPARRVMISAPWY